MAGLLLPTRLAAASEERIPKLAINTVRGPIKSALGLDFDLIVS